MLATYYTADPASSVWMRNRLHNEPQRTLARNLKAVLEQRKLSARALERQLKAKGSKISNRTIQNMVNGTGNPGLENLMEVAAAIKVPLWQLLCQGADTSKFSDSTAHELLDAFAELSEIGRRAIQDQVDMRLLVERTRKSPPADDSDSLSVT
jgi:transcriptional regulator with XRE-family HTH domain